jgi:hypothetical protein
MTNDPNIGPIDPVKADAYRWMCALGRLCAGLETNVIWNAPSTRSNPDSLAAAKLRAVQTALKKCHGSRTAAAVVLGIPRSSLYAILRKAGPALACAVFVAGCATANPPARGDARPTTPPMPPIHSGLAENHKLRNQTAQVESQSAALIGPPAPKRLTVTWDKNEPHPDCVTQLWASGDLVTWSLLGEFATPRADVFADQPRQFYKARNRVGSQFSEWATK